MKIKSILYVLLFSTMMGTSMAYQDQEEESDELNVTSGHQNITAEYIRKNSLAAYQHRNGTFVFSPKKHMWYAYDSSGKLVKSGRASGGKGYCPDTGRRCYTPVGRFSVVSKGGPGCVSSVYPVGEGGAPMPYCMFFSKYYAIHGSYDVPNRNASHGCIRVTPSAAHWLSQHFIHIGTRVIVLSY